MNRPNGKAFLIKKGFVFGMAWVSQYRISRMGQRRKRLVWKYNQIYNNTRIRKYDGSYLTFPGMNPEITLQAHQKNAVARIRKAEMR